MPSCKWDKVVRLLCKSCKFGPLVYGQTLMAKYKGLTMKFEMNSLDKLVFTLPFLFLIISQPEAW